MKILSYLLFAGILTISSAPAQEDVNEQAADSLGAEIIVLARVDVDSVVLRWAPDKAGAWVMLNDSGYIIERAEVDTLSEFRQESIIRLNSEPVKPWALEKWRQRVPENDDFAAVAVEVLYGERFVVEPFQQQGNAAAALMNAADELSSRYAMALYSADNSSLAAEGLGLRYVDRDIETGKTYIYRVSPAAEDTSYVIRGGTEVVTIAPHQPDPPPLDLEAEGGDGSITLSWKERPPVSYSGYYIYRSADGGQTYQRLNDVPHVYLADEEAGIETEHYFLDTSAVNYQPYHYRVRGVTPFAELSEAAGVAAMARDYTPPDAPMVQTPEQIGTKSLKISWTYPDTVADLEGFYVSRSYHHDFRTSHRLTDSPLPSYSREYEDLAATAKEPWYFVAAVDTAGNIFPSLAVYGELIDSIPPAVPEGLTATIDSSGVVSLHWRPGDEEDLMGYRLLWANHPDHEFTPVISRVIRDTAYQDTISLNTLTRHIYYRLVALDMRYNPSALSHMLTVRRPDIVPPDPAVFSDVVVSDSSVNLSWHRSPSDDVLWQKLFRKYSQDTIWIELRRFVPSVFSYTDTAVIQNRMYDYRLTVEDSSGYQTDSPVPVSARPYDSGKRQPPQNVVALYDSSTHRVTVSWYYQQARKENYYFVIYRSTGNRQLRSFKSVSSSQLRYEDSSVEKNHEYHYAVKMVTRNGAQSELSNQAAVYTGQNDQ